MDILPDIIHKVSEWFGLKVDKYIAGRTYSQAYMRRYKRFIPGNPGVYILCENDEIVYIGQSQSISVRLSSGHKIFRQGKFTVYTLTTIEDYGLRYGIESLLIGVIKPKLNEGLGFERIDENGV